MRGEGAYPVASPRSATRNGFSPPWTRSARRRSSRAASCEARDVEVVGHALGGANGRPAGDAKLIPPGRKRHLGHHPTPRFLVVTNSGLNASVISTLAFEKLSFGGRRPQRDGERAGKPAASLGEVQGLDAKLRAIATFACWSLPLYGAANRRMGTPATPIGLCSASTIAGASVDARVMLGVLRRSGAR